MWTYGESLANNISMKAVIVTLILQVDHKNHFFRVLGTGTRYGLEILQKCDKRVKTKSKKLLGTRVGRLKRTKKRASGQAKLIFCLARMSTFFSHFFPHETILFTSGSIPF